MQGQDCPAGDRMHTWQPCICGQCLEIGETVYIEVLEMLRVLGAGEGPNAWSPTHLPT